MTKEIGEENIITPNISVAHTTDVGLCREENQDSYGIIQTEYFKCYVVADGMGGVKGGAIASSLAIDVLRESLEKERELNEDVLTRVVEVANRAIFERGVNDNNLTGMGTTLVAIAIQRENVFVINVGDSRAYRFHGNEIKQITRDHTLVGELLRSGAINEDQAANHPVSHMLTRSLGPVPEVEPDITTLKTADCLGDLFILCSDGLYNMVHPEEFVEVLQSLPLEDVPEELISLANLRGGVDNITVIALRFSDGKFTSSASSDSNSESGKSTNFVLVNGHDSVKEEKVEKEAKAEERASEVTQTATSNPPQTPEEIEEEIKRRKREELTKELFRYLSVAFIAAVGTAFIFWGIYSYQSFDQIGVITANLNEKHSADPVTIVNETAQPQIEVKEGNLETAPVVDDGTIEAAQKERIDNRRGEINERLIRLRDLMAAFDQPMTGTLAEAFQRSSDRIIEVDREGRNVEASLSDASRKLSQWLGYKRRLDTTDTLSLALDVSKSSLVVKESQDIFRATTYEYLKGYENHRANPLDLSLEAQVKALAKKRANEVRNLDLVLRQAIGNEISSTDRLVGDLTYRRDELQRLKSFLEIEISAIKAIMGSNPTSQAEARDKIKRLISELEGELLQISSL